MQNPWESGGFFYSARSGLERISSGSTGMLRDNFQRSSSNLLISSSLSPGFLSNSSILATSSGTIISSSVSSRSRSSISSFTFLKRWISTIMLSRSPSGIRGIRKHISDRMRTGRKLNRPLWKPPRKKAWRPKQKLERLLFMVPS